MYIIWFISIDLPARLLIDLTNYDIIISALISSLWFENKSFFKFIIFNENCTKIDFQKTSEASLRISVWDFNFNFFPLDRANSIFRSRISWIWKYFDDALNTAL